MLGQQLPEVVGPFFSQLSTALVAGMAAWEDFRQSTLGWGGSTLEAGKTAVESMGYVQMAVGKVSDVIDVLKLAWYAMRSVVSGVVADVVGKLAYIGKAIDYIIEATTGKKAGIGDFLGTWSEDLERLSTDQWDTFQKKLAEPWPSESVNSYFDNAKKKIEETRAEVQKSATDFTKMTGEGGVDKAGKAPKKEFGGAFEAGTKEAVSTILRSHYGVGDDNSLKKVAGNSDKQIAILETISEKLGNIESNTEDSGFDMADI